jgi:hypothetical protein
VTPPVPRIAVVLYEDSRGRQPRDFGPHSLALACVADDLGVDSGLWHLKASFPALPKNGNAELLKALEREANDLRAGGTEIVAVIDDDRIRDPLRLPPAACKRAVLDQVLAKRSTPVDVILLERNVEDLVELAAQVLGLAGAPRKSRNVRDAMLMRLARPERQSDRSRLRRQMPSFDRLISVLVRAWGAR